MRTLVAFAGLAVVTTFAACTTTVQVTIEGETYSCSRTDHFTVVHAPSELKASPHCVAAPVGSTVTIRFVNHIDGKAQTMAKGNGPTWLNRDNKQGDPQQIAITLMDKGNYAFLLEVEGTGSLDPRIVVQ
jgi:hypothetical protein